ncbi:MAG: hypothetical protein Hyperionvirus2_37 [Hyperionvirus sp.]|uniref:Uncharacterized protein n=1 Tax=Hyperionvirus sp. TaxID=2487770 RepID=A0A3G5ABI6_9VIRU|nr:MAG: hypothetical protein Hyperionvirus2_37 [Hyperionvirus sp.]
MGEVSAVMGIVRERIKLSHLILASFDSYCDIGGEGGIFGALSIAMATLSMGHMPKTPGRDISLFLSLETSPGYDRKFQQFEADFDLYTLAKEKYGLPPIKFGTYELLSVKKITDIKDENPNLKLFLASPTDRTIINLMGWQIESYSFSAESCIMVDYINNLQAIVRGQTHLTPKAVDDSDGQDPMKMLSLLGALSKYHAVANQLKEDFDLIPCGKLPVMRTSLNSELIGIDGKFLEIGLDCADKKCRKKCTECKECTKIEHACNYLPINTLVGMCTPAINNIKPIQCPFCKGVLKILFTSTTTPAALEPIDLSNKSLLTLIKKDEKKISTDEEIFKNLLEIPSIPEEQPESI